MNLKFLLKINLIFENYDYLYLFYKHFKNMEKKTENQLLLKDVMNSIEEFYALDTNERKFSKKIRNYLKKKEKVFLKLIARF